MPLFSRDKEAKKDISLMEQEAKEPISGKKKFFSWSSAGKYALFAFFFLAPLVFLPFTLNPVGEGKQLVVGLLLLFAFIGYLANVISNGKIVLPRTLVLIPLVVLVGLVGVASWLSAASDVSIWSTASDSFFSVVLYGLAFLLPFIFLRSTQSLTKAALLGAGSVVLVSLFGILQLNNIHLLPFDWSRIASFNPVGGTFSLGVTAGALFVALFAALMSSISLPRKALFILAEIILGYLILLLNFPPIWLGVAVATAFLVTIKGYPLLRERNKGMQKLSVFFFVIIVAVLFAFIRPPVFLPGNVPAEISPSVGGTYQILKEGVTDVKRAVIGSGPATFPYQWSLYRSEAINNTSFWGVQFGQGRPALLSYIITWGFLGAIALLAFLVLYIRALAPALMRLVAEKEKGVSSNLRAVALGSFLASVFLGALLFFYSGNFIAHLFLFASAGLAVGAVSRARLIDPLQINLATSPQKMLLGSLLSLFLISFTAAGLYFVVQRYVAASYFAGGVREYNTSQNLPATIEKINRAVTLDPQSDQYYRTGSQALLLRLSQLLRKEDLSQEQIQRSRAVLANTINTARSAVQINSNNMQNWIQLGRVYEQIIGLVEGAEKFAVQSYEKAARLAPNNPSVPAAMARSRTIAANALQQKIAALRQQGGEAAQIEELIAQRKEHYTKAKEDLEKALALKSDYATAGFLMAQIHEREGNLGQAISELEKIVSSTPRPLVQPALALQLGLLYYKDRQFNQAKAAFGLAIERLPNYANALYFLGLTHDRLGETQEAIQRFEKVAGLNPDNQEVKQILGNLRAGRPALAGSPTEPIEGTEPPIPEEGGAEEEPLPSAGNTETAE